MEQTFEILINELVADEEFRDSFLRNPRRALHLAGDWGLPLCESEIHALMTIERSRWDEVAEEVDARLQMAALAAVRRWDGRVPLPGTNRRDCLAGQ